MSICEIRGRISYARNFCEFGEIRGRISYARNFREFCEFCGRIGRVWRGYGRMPYPPTKTPTDCTDVQIYTEPSAEKRLPQISQIYTETFSKKVLCALRILWEFLYTNLKCEICGKQPAHQPNKKYTHQGVQRSPLHQQSRRCTSCSVGTPFSGGAAVSAAPTK